MRSYLKMRSSVRTVGMALRRPSFAFKSSCTEQHQFPRGVVGGKMRTTLVRTAGSRAENQTVYLSHSRTSCGICYSIQHQSVTLSPLYHAFGAYRGVGVRLYIETDINLRCIQVYPPWAEKGKYPEVLCGEDRYERQC
jgi:hypothetical protein